MSRQEAHRKRLAEQERERELAKKLGQLGSGMGGEYMRVRQSSPDRASASSSRAGARKEAATPDDDPFLQPEVMDAASLGLLGNKASDVNLGHSKRKRLPGSLSSEPRGWSGAYKKGFTSPKKAPEKAAELSPTKKKARFILEKGIRLPGRESLPNTKFDEDDDDDGLDIV